MLKSKKMGIKGLNKLLEDVCGDFTKEVPMSSFAYQRIAVDASLYLFKFHIIFKDKVIDAYIDLIVRLREKKIHPVFVFDGVSPPEKQEEKKNREADRVKNEERIKALETDLALYEKDQTLTDLLAETYKKTVGKTAGQTAGQAGDPPFDFYAMWDYVDKLRSRIVNITTADYDLMKETLDILGVPWIQAPMEAEILCVQLCKQNLVAAVMSSDTDILAAHCPVVIRDINNKKFVCVYISDILETLEFTPEEFTDLCIMCGTDFNKNIPKIGPKNSLKLLRQYRKIENIPRDTSILNYERVRELFKHEEWPSSVPFCKPIKYTQLESWLETKNASTDLDNIRSRIG